MPIIMPRFSFRFLCLHERENQYPGKRIDGTQDKSFADPGDEDHKTTIETKTPSWFHDNAATQHEDSFLREQVLIAKFFIRDRLGFLRSFEVE